MGKIGRICTTDEGRIDIELPPLNMALLEVHDELTMVGNGGKDLFIKNKRLKKIEKYVQK